MFFDTRICRHLMWFDKWQQTSCWCLIPQNSCFKIKFDHQRLYKTFHIVTSLKYLSFGIILITYQKSSHISQKLFLYACKIQVFTILRTSNANPMFPNIKYYIDEKGKLVLRLTCNYCLLQPNSCDATFSLLRSCMSLALNSQSKYKKSYYTSQIFSRVSKFYGVQKVY